MLFPALAFLLCVHLSLINAESDCIQPTAEECQKCDLTRNPSMYLFNPCTCGYYQCVLDQFGGFTVYDMPCPKCQCWDQDKLTCVLDPESTDTDCSATPPPEDVTDDGKTCTASGPGYTSKFEIVEGEPNFYYQYITDDHKVKMPCPSGTTFSVEKCLCALEGPVTAPRPFMCLTFDKENPFDTLTGVYADAKNVKVVNGGVVGKAAYFSGDDSNIEIPAYTNKETPEMSVSLWFKREGGNGNGVQTLVSNDDCQTTVDASIKLMSSTNKTVSGGYRTSYGTNQINAFKDVQVNAADSWNHVAMTYDGSTISFYLNGAEIKTVRAAGPVQAVQCPLLIGSMYGKNFFTGWMDQVCFYNSGLNSDQVNNLYNKPGDVI